MTPTADVLARLDAPYLRGPSDLRDVLVERGPLILDAYAGPGGWDTGLQMLDRHRVLGLEWDATAATTARAAGHRREVVDVSKWEPYRLDGERVDLLVGSPPCPTFSLAGSGVGRLLLPILARAITDLLAGRPAISRARRQCMAVMRRHLLTDPVRGRQQTRDQRHRWAARQVEDALQVLQPARLIYRLRPRAVALEQVVPVLPLWKVYAYGLRALGYSVKVGKLNAADYGVPQTRERAILAARCDGIPAQLPAPTHCRGGEEPDLFGPGRDRWVSMAEALGAYDERWAQLLGGRPARTVTTSRIPRWLYATGARSYDTGWTVRTSTNSMSANRRADDMVPYEREVDAPAPTVDGKTNRWKVAPGGEHEETPRDRAILRTGCGTEFATPDGRQHLDPVERPAPTLTAKSGGQWQVETDGDPAGEPPAAGWSLRNNTSDNAAERTADEPAPTVFFGGRLNGGWVLRPNGTMPQDRTIGRTPDEPAPTVAFGHNAAAWTLTRPATTVQGDPRVFPPGHKASTEAEHASGKYEDRAGTNALRIEAWQAGVLQSFPPDYPWQGNRTAQYRQVGDCVPPLLAAHVCAPLLDLDQPGGDS
jgi:DNA (cytosine-5)-methyltransferase 1